MPLTRSYRFVLATLLALPSQYPELRRFLDAVRDAERTATSSCSDR